jgi:hypothetical protein
MAATLTDRYVEATARGLDDAQRPEVERELRATIEDMIDGRLAAGASDRAQAERQVLTELGDPMRLAAGYTGRPLHLIGPAVYPDWVRLVKLLLGIIVPLSMAGSALAQALLGDEGQAVGEIVASAVLTGLGVAGHILFWTTLVFAVIERSGGTPKPLVAWTPDQLPDISAARRVSLGDTAVSLALLVVTAGAIVWQHLASPVRSDGESVPVLDPALWSFWLPWFLAVLLAEMVFVVVLYRTGSWSWPLAGVNVALNLAFGVPAVSLLLSDRLFNDAFIAQLVADGWVEAEAHLRAVTAVSVIAVTAWDSVDGALKARRHTAARAAADL